MKCMIFYFKLMFLHKQLLHTYNKRCGVYTMQNIICYTNAYITRTCKIQVLNVFHVLEKKNNTWLW